MEKCTKWGALIKFFCEYQLLDMQENTCQPLTPDSQWSAVPRHMKYSTMIDHREV